ncbi:MAG: phosphate signaling complex protein PhoU [Thermoanaerobaculia bacterium]
MKRHFEKEIEELEQHLLEMGALVQRAMERSIQALLERDSELAERVIGEDDVIDRLELEIDAKTMELIATVQPTAVDLRAIAAIMKITPELERIADLAQDVCERAVELNREPQLKPFIDLPVLASNAQEMVKLSIDSFVKLDADLARDVIRRDDDVDRLTEVVFRELLTYMLEDPRNISRAIRLTFIGKYFERMADGATNIAEMVVYLVEGRSIKHMAESELLKRGSHSPNQEPG